VTTQELEQLAAEQGPIEVTLLGLDGNAFSIIGTLSRQARRQGWQPGAWGQVMAELTAGDYDHLLQTAMAVCRDGGMGEVDS
jgi:hypothetical protein